MSLFDDITAHLGSGKTLYTKARGTKFRAQVAGGVLVVESERSGRKTITPTQVEAAAKAIATSAPPLDDRAVQVARSWVGAINDSMAGSANPAKRASPSRAMAKPRQLTKTTKGKSVSKPAPRRSTTTTRATGTAPKKRSSAAPKASARAQPAKPTPTRPRSVPQAAARPATPPAPAVPTAADIAVSIGREIARAIGEAKATPERTDDATIVQITDQLASLTTQIETLRTERDAAVAQVARAERQLQSWRTVATQVGGLATVALAPMPKHDASPLPPEVADLLAQAARSWKSAPSGSVGTSRSALELVLRLVAARVTGTDEWGGAGFAALRELLASRPRAQGNLSESDLHLARDLYSRSSKSSHGEDGWKPTAIDALLLWAGVLTISQRAFGTGKA
ncbi:MAG: hypothetical protein MUQ32_03030 [Chloroflexi bacterium]|nr:hypothetical protein [Chloroflexota bacterium]